jgi:hemerythrin-like domain-containing protein
MQATQVLVHEHDVIRQALAVLEAVTRKIVAGEPVPPEELDGLLEFFSAFADGCHHAKEEGILFPALEASGIPREGGPIGVLLGEHVVGRSLVRAMRGEVPSLGDSAEARDHFAGAAREYVALLEQHIAKENEVLFRLAEQTLSAEQDREITQAFDRHEREEMGPGVHERFHRVLDELAAAHL